MLNETNKIVDELVNIFAGKVMTKHENEVLYRTVKLIHDLEDQSKLYKSLLPTQKMDGGNN